MNNAHLQTRLTYDKNTTIYGADFDRGVRQFLKKLQIILTVVISQSITGRDAKYLFSEMYHMFQTCRSNCPYYLSALCI